jgi:hypothetical protein
VVVVGVDGNNNGRGRKTDNLAEAVFLRRDESLADMDQIGPWARGAEGVYFICCVLAESCAVVLAQRRGGQVRPESPQACITSIYYQAQPA